MPSGKIHSSCSVVLSIPVAIIAYSIGGPLAGTICGIGCLSGILLTPDLDQESISTSEYWLIKYTMGLGFLWAMIWYPYARLCKHRSFWSHFPVIGTMGRLAYIGIFAALAVCTGWGLQVNWVIFAWWAAGLVCSDSAHWLLDAHYGDTLKRLRTTRHVANRFMK